MAAAGSGPLAYTSAEEVRMEAVVAATAHGKFYGDPAPPQRLTPRQRLTH